MYSYVGIPVTSVRPTCMLFQSRVSSANNYTSFRKLLFRLWSPIDESDPFEVLHFADEDIDAIQVSRFLKCPDYRQIPYSICGTRLFWTNTASSLFTLHIRSHRIFHLKRMRQPGQVGNLNILCLPIPTPSISNS